MNYNKKPVKGMKDYLPNNTRLREYVLTKIKDIYTKHGFSLIEMPALERIENLCNNEGGENEKLIFKILKRGNALSIKNFVESKDINNLVDSALRYDLTVPLARYYSNNMNELTYPFKSLHIGDVWRADRPQKGRFRQFKQCDVDVIGESSNIAEIELLSASIKLLLELGIKGFRVHINDREILKSMAIECGFSLKILPNVYIILDKMDNIGIEGIRSELIDSGFNKDSIDKYIAKLNGRDHYQDCRKFCAANMSEAFNPSTAENIDMIISCVNLMVKGDYQIFFDPTLVRGMSYYTGAIFEIEVPGYPFSIGGGGRYDKIISHFTGMDISACGFSIGFERILTIIEEQEFVVPEQTDRIAFLIEKGTPPERIIKIFEEAEKMRENGSVILVSSKNNNLKNQKNKMKELGYNHIKIFNNDDSLSQLNKL